MQIQRQRTLENNPQTSPVVKTEQSSESPHQPHLYRLSPSPGPGLSFDANVSSAYRDSHQVPHNHGNCSPSSDCNVNYASSSSSTSSMGYSQPRQSGSVLAMTNADLYYHQPYIRSSDSTAPDPACGCLTNPAAAHPLISLTHQLQSTIDLLRQLPEHAARGSCGLLKHIGQLNDLMQCVFNYVN